MLDQRIDESTFAIQRADAIEPISVVFPQFIVHERAGHQFGSTGARRSATTAGKRSQINAPAVPSWSSRRLKNWSCRLISREGIAVWPYNERKSLPR